MPPALRKTNDRERLMLLEGIENVHWACIIVLDRNGVFVALVRVNTLEQFGRCKTDYLKTPKRQINSHQMMNISCHYIESVSLMPQSTLKRTAPTFVAVLE